MSKLSLCLCLSVSLLKLKGLKENAGACHTPGLLVGRAPGAVAAPGQGTPGLVAAGAQARGVARDCFTLPARINILQQLISQPPAGLQRNLGVQSREYLRARACSRPGERPPRPPPPQLPDPTHLALLRSRLRPPAAPVPVARSRRPGERTTALDLRVAAPARSPRVRGEVCSTPDGRSVGSKAICGLRADLAPPSRTTGTGIPARRAGAGY